MDDSHDPGDNVSFHSVNNKDCEQQKIEKKHFNRIGNLFQGDCCIFVPIDYMQDLEQIMFTAAFAGDNANICELLLSLSWLNWQLVF